MTVQELLLKMQMLLNGYSCIQLGKIPPWGESMEAGSVYRGLLALPSAASQDLRLPGA